MRREIKFRSTYEGETYEVKTVDKPSDNRGAHNFKGYQINGGYVLRRVINHPLANGKGYYLEHRLVMEEHLGRFLDKDEVVHHIDGNRKNNEITNLIALYQEEHAGMEMVGKRNPNGTMVAEEQIFQDIKFRLYDKDRGITNIYCLSKLIGTTFRRGKFEFRGRWTGLYDKNGKEIYEGDILQMFWKNGGKCGEPFLMKWEDERSGWFDYYPKDGVKVIGNIYENPSLLEVQP